MIGGVVMSNVVALITGGSRGIGKAIAIEFANAGVNLVINYHRHEALANRLKEKIQTEYGVDVLCVQADVSREEDVEDMVNQAVDYYGKIDILINNAGISKDSLLLDKSVSNIKRVIDVNLIGTYLCSKYIGKVMLDRGGGKIINIASTNAIDTYYPESCDYDASKAGVISLTHNLAREFAPHIIVNCVCPGWVKTDMNKELSIEQIQSEEEKILLHRFAEPEEIAKVVVFLASSKASYVNDSIIRVDGGKFNG